MEHKKKPKKTVQFPKSQCINWCINSQSKVIGENCGVILNRNICFLCSREECCLKHPLQETNVSLLHIEVFGWVVSQLALPSGRRWGHAHWKAFTSRQEEAGLECCGLWCCLLARPTATEAAGDGAVAPCLRTMSGHECCFFSLFPLGMSESCC